ncbi:MAG: hypothetical protein ACHQF3_06335, partial [Alphaproteobacteria bacterium]
LVGAMVAVLLPEWLRIAESHYLMAYAGLVMVLMVFCPSGILGLLERAARALGGSLPSAGAAAALGGEPQP